jgi:beta-lactamase regulating signal transducer with metallopeptidase domain/biotin carboxyl carrier protein
MNLGQHTIDALAAVWREAMLRGLWQGSIALVLALVICLFPFRASIKSWVWRGAYAKLLLAFFFTAAISLPLLQPRRPLLTPGIQKSAANEIRLSNPPEIAHPVAFEVGQYAALSVVTGRQDASRSTAERLYRPNWLRVLFLCWGIGTLLGGIRLLRCFLAARRLRKNCMPIEDLQIQTRLASLSERLDVKAPALMACETVSNPLLIGIVRPAIVLPPRITKAPPDELDIVLAHELAHLKRCDLAWNWLGTVVKTIFWFHPLVWICVREWRLAQEIACDELALRATSAPPAQYGTLLLEFAARITAEPAALISASMISNKKSLERRLKAMKNFSRNKSLGWATALILICITIGVIPWRVVAQKTTDESTANKTEKKKVPDLADIPEVKTPSPDALNDASRQLYAREIELAKRELDDFQRGYENGKVDSTALIQQQREIARLNRELARYENNQEGYKKSLLEEIKLIDQLIADQKKRIENGVDTRNSGLKLERERLRLERELAEADRSFAPKYPPTKPPNSGHGVVDIAALQKQFDDQTEKVRRVQKEVDERRFQLGFSDLGDNSFQSTSEAETVRNLEANRTKYELEYTQSFTLYTNLAGMSRNDLRRAIPTASPDGAMDRYLIQLAEAETQYAALRGDFSEEHPQVVKLASVIKTLNEQIEARIDGVLNGLKSLVDTRKNTLEKITQMVKEAKERDARKRRDYAPYFASKRDLETQQRIHDIIYARILQETVDAQIPKSTAVETVDQARASNKPVRSNVPLSSDLTITGLMEDAQLKTLVAALNAREKELAEAGDNKGSREALERDIADLKKRIERDKDDSANWARENSDVPPTTVVSSRAGVVQKLLVKVGEHVRSGQPLVRLDDREARARLETVMAERRVTGTAVSLEEIELKEVQKEYKRKKELAEQKLVSDSEVPNPSKAELKLRQAQAQYDVTLQKEMEARLEAEMFTITAPVSGTIESILVQPGGAVITPLVQGVVKIIPDKKQERGDSLGF